MLGQARLLAIAPGEFHKAAGATDGVPHRLVNKREIGRVRVEGVVTIDGIPGEVERVGDDEEDQEEVGDSRI